MALNPSPASPCAFPDAAGARGTFIALTCAVSLAYAAASTADTLPVHLGGAVGIAALAWCGLFGLTWWLSPAAQRVPRFDWCLWTVTVGSMVMLVWLALGQAAAAAGLRSELTRVAPLAGLATADLAMAWVFVRYAPTVAVRRHEALLIWVGGMNGLLALGLLLGAILLGDGR